MKYTEEMILQSPSGYCMPFEEDEGKDIKVLMGYGEQKDTATGTSESVIIRWLHWQAVSFPELEMIENREFTWLYDMGSMKYPIVAWQTFLPSLDKPWKQGNLLLSAETVCIWQWASMVKNWIR